MMQDLVGIVRSEEEMARALRGIKRFGKRAAAAFRSPATANTTSAGTRRSTCPIS